MSNLENGKNNSHWKVLGLLAGCAIGVGIGTYLYASRVEARRYQLEKLRVTINGGAQRRFSRPLKILHISDLHLSHPESHKIEFLQRVTDDDYDLVILTGDIFENESGVPYAGQLLSRAPRLGAYAVLGNHDYYDYNMWHKTFGRIVRKFRHPAQKRDVTPMVEALESGGFKVLRNNSITFPEEGLHVIGVDYPGVSQQHLLDMSDKCHPEHLLLALFHVPQNLESYVKAGVHLAFGGHTHGGQIRIPGYGAIITDSELPGREASGLFHRGDTAFHISRGVGADPRTNFRLFCPPHATVLEVACNG